MLADKAGLEGMDLVHKIVCIATDGTAVFTGCNGGLCQMMKRSAAPFVQPMHCIAHKTQLCAAVLKEVPLVQRQQNLVRHIHTHFCKSAKSFNELIDLSVDMNLAPPKKMLRYVETRWMSLYEPLLRLHDTYPLVALKMDDDARAGKDNAWGLRSEMLDLEMILGHTLLFPLLRELVYLVKTAQEATAHVQHLRCAVEMCISRLRKEYVSEEAFDPKAFREFDHIMYSEQSMLQWGEGDDGVLHLQVGEGEKKVMLPLHVTARTGRAGRPGTTAVTNELFLATAEYMKVLVTQAALSVIEEIETRFPPMPLLTGFDVIYADFWADAEKADGATVLANLEVLEDFYCTPKMIVTAEGEEHEIAPILNGPLLREQRAFFLEQIVMHSRKSVEKARGEKVKNGAILPWFATSHMWQTMYRSPSIRHRMSEYFRLADLALVLIGG
jgi:hypothetical protein